MKTGGEPHSLGVATAAQLPLPLPAGGRTCPNTPVVVLAPKGDVFCPNAGVCWPNGEGDVAPKGLALAPKPAERGHRSGQVQREVRGASSIS